MKFSIILGEEGHLYSAVKAKEGNERWIFTSQFSELLQSSELKKA